MIDYDYLDVIDIKVVSKMFDIDEYDVDQSEYIEFIQNIVKGIREKRNGSC